MFFKLKRGSILIIFILLQSCSGGRIGNFLESSFNNIEESKINEDTNNLKNNLLTKPKEKLKNNKKDIKEPKIKEDTNNLKNNLLTKPKEKLKNNKKDIKESKIKEDTNNLKNNLLTKPKEKLKNNKKNIKQNISLKKRQFQPQSYKIIFILKDVDPKDPIEDLSTILRNSDVNFEIEKIERFVDSKNKTIKDN